MDGAVQTKAAKETQMQEFQVSLAGFDFSNENTTMKYVSHENGRDADGKQCVIIYYDYTNRTSAPKSALFATMTNVFQNGQRCVAAFLRGGTNQALEDYFYMETAPGATTRVAEAFLISDLSDITVEAYQFLESV